MANAFGARVGAGADYIGQAGLMALRGPRLPLPVLTQQLGDSALLGEHVLRQIVATQAKA